MAGATASLDWALPLIGWSVVAVASLLLLRALFSDRPRGRRRCPRCWYDMTGLPGLLCPECGHDAGRERRLLKTRRRRGLAVCALLIGLTGVGVLSFDRARKSGLASLVPSSLLVFVAPAQTPASSTGLGVMMAQARLQLQPTYANQKNLRAQLFPRSYVSSVQVTAPPPRSLSESLCDEAWNRLVQGRLWRWQSQRLIQRWLDANPKDAPIVTLPARWPLGLRMPITLTPPPLPVQMEVRLDGGEWSSGRMLLPPASEMTVPSMAMQFLADGKVVFTGRIPAAAGIGPGPPAIRGEVATFLDRLDTPDAAALILRALQPQVVLSDGQLSLKFNDRHDGEPWPQIDFGLYFAAELRAGGRTVARCWSFAERVRPIKPGLEPVLVPFRPVGPIPPLGEPLKLVIRGDPEAAGAGYTAADGWPRDRAVCWSGEFTVPVPPLPAP